MTSYYKFAKLKDWRAAEKRHKQYVAERAVYKREKKIYDSEMALWQTEYKGMLASAERKFTVKKTVFGQRKRSADDMTISQRIKAEKEGKISRRKPGRIVAEQENVIDEEAVAGVMVPWERRNPQPVKPAKPMAFTSPGPMPKEAWEHEPGEEGFNREAYKKMNKALPELQMTCERTAGVFRPQAYQETVPWMMSPMNPMHRMLVVAKTGAGKTFTMVRVLSEYFDDPRPKICIFPTESVARNFYQEICKFPSRYRDFIGERLGESIFDRIEGTAGKEECNSAISEVEALLGMNRMLRMAGQPGQLASPVA